MAIKWTKYTYRIVCAQKGIDGQRCTVDQLVNGYVCSANLHDSNRPWPVGSHKNGKLWTLTDLISGLKVHDFAKRPTADELTICMQMIVNYWGRRSRERGLFGPALDQQAYETLCPFTPELRLVEPVTFCIAWYAGPEFRYMKLCRGWNLDDNERIEEQ